MVEIAMNISDADDANSEGPLEDFSEDFSEDGFVESAAERLAEVPLTDGRILRPGDAVAFDVDASQSGWRLDQFLAYQLPVYSRVYLRRVIGTGSVHITERTGTRRGGKPAYRLKPGQTVGFVLPEIPRESPIPEAIPLEILYEDDRMAVVNKPPGMVVHPARGHWSGTLASALQYHFGGHLSILGGPTRPGIVHRLDRDTSGVILVAKDDLAHRNLTEQFAARTTEKEYVAITVGAPHLDRDVVREPLGPHPRHREQMAIRRDLPDASPAETWFEVVERYRRTAESGDERSDAWKNGRFGLVIARPKTGRTHQIRVHLAYLGAAILCDRLYGNRAQITESELLGGRRDERGGDTSPIVLTRQALHARRIRFNHPGTGERMEVVAPIPADMERVLTVLRTLRS